MNRVFVRFGGGLVLVAVVLGAHASARQAPLPQMQSQIQSAKQDVPAFRSRITLVPLDVRVLDLNGKPVTDLTQDDFTILEKGERQTISRFWASGLVPESPPPDGRPGFRSAPGDQLAPQRGRTFLLVVGRGRIQQPFDGVGALITFVRERLLPQDRVAVMAYHRATDFTSDRERIVALLQRINDRHERIDALLEAELTAGRPWQTLGYEPAQRLADMTGSRSPDTYLAGRIEVWQDRDNSATTPPPARGTGSSAT